MNAPAVIGLGPASSGPDSNQISTLQRSFVLSALGASNSNTAVTTPRRLDDRLPLASRKITHSYPSLPARGQCSVSLGESTRAMADITAKLTAPTSDRPFEGAVNVDVLAGPENGTVSSGITAEVARLLDRCLKRSGCIDREALCVVAGQKVWTIDITIHLQADDGNIIDCACLAAVLALQDFLLPETDVTGSGSNDIGDVTVFSYDERIGLPLPLLFLPICITFAFVATASGMLLLLDPSWEELKLGNLEKSTMTLCMTQQKELCVIQKSGGAALDEAELMQGLEVGIRVANERGAYIESARRPLA